MKNRSSRHRMLSRKNNLRIVAMLEERSQGIYRYFKKQNEFVEKTKAKAKKIAAKTKSLFSQPVKRREHRTVG